MQLKQSLKQSSYTTSTHIVQKSSPPNLFKINKVSHDEKLSNLCILLNGQTTSFKVLPKNEDALKIIRHNVWYVGYCIGINNDGTYRIEHIHRTNKNCNLKWRYPSKEDIADVEEDQILDCDIDGDWDVLSNRNNEFSLRNHEFINKMFIDMQRNV